MDVQEFTFGKEYYHRFDEMRNWCELRFGQGQWIYAACDARWGYSQAFGNTTYYFQQDSDATLFALKWL